VEGSMKKTMLGIGVAVLSLLAMPAMAQKSYGPGVSDTEIKIGNTAPYSGPVSAASTVAKSIAAYFDKVNAEGGVNGRKINFLTVDDGYQPPKTVEETRRLVEQEKVLLMLGSVGTPSQLAVRRYLNQQKVPQLFIASGSGAFYDPQSSPWSMSSTPSYYAEGKLIGKHLSKTMSGVTIALLFQNDDFGKEFARGIKEDLTDGAKIVAETSYETSDPTVDSQIVTLQASGAKVLALMATQKASAQGIRKAYDSGWKPKIVLPSVIASIAAVLQPAGLEKSIGVIAATYRKEPNDPQWAKDPAVVAYNEWAVKYNTKVDPGDSSAASGGYIAAQMMVAVLKACGDDLSRENVLKQATNLNALRIPILLDGITINTTPTDYELIKQMQFQSFNGKGWDLYGSIVSN
jgi:branched-chain amino acid transport system substrate-binding protein